MRGPGAFALRADTLADSMPLPGRGFLSKAGLLPLLGLEPLFPPHQVSFVGAVPVVSAPRSISTMRVASRRRKAAVMGDEKERNLLTEEEFFEPEHGWPDR